MTYGVYMKKRADLKNDLHRLTIEKFLDKWLELVELLRACEKENVDAVVKKMLEDLGITERSTGGFFYRGDEYAKFQNVFERYTNSSFPTGLLRLWSCYESINVIIENQVIGEGENSLDKYKLWIKKVNDNVIEKFCDFLVQKIRNDQDSEHLEQIWNGLLKTKEKDLFLDDEFAKISRKVNLEKKNICQFRTMAEMMNYCIPILRLDHDAELLKYLLLANKYHVLYEILVLMSKFLLKEQVVKLISDYELSPDVDFIVYLLVSKAMPFNIQDKFKSNIKTGAEWLIEYNKNNVLEDNIFMPLKKYSIEENTYYWFEDFPIKKLSLFKNGMFSLNCSSYYLGLEREIDFWSLVHLAKQKDSTIQQLHTISKGKRDGEYFIHETLHPYGMKSQVGISRGYDALYAVLHKNGKEDTTGVVRLEVDRKFKEDIHEEYQQKIDAVLEKIEEASGDDEVTLLMVKQIIDDFRRRQKKWMNSELLDSILKEKRRDLKNTKQFSFFHKEDLDVNNVYVSIHWKPKDSCRYQSATGNILCPPVITTLEQIKGYQKTNCIRGYWFVDAKLPQNQLKGSSKKLNQIKSTAKKKEMQDKDTLVILDLGCKKAILDVYPFIDMERRFHLGKKRDDSRDKFVFRIASKVAEQKLNKNVKESLSELYKALIPKLYFRVFSYQKSQNNYEYEFLLYDDFCYDKKQIIDTELSFFPSEGKKQLSIKEKCSCKNVKCREMPTTLHVNQYDKVQIYWIIYKFTRNQE